MLPHPAMSTHHPLTKYARLWLALAPNLLLVALALFWPHDGEDRGPALLSVAGHQHFILLHFPVAILMLVPFFEIWDRHGEAGLTIRRLSLLGAVSIWATCLFGLLEARFNGGDYTGLDQHLWLGIAAKVVQQLLLEDCMGKRTFAGKLAALVWERFLHTCAWRACHPLLTARCGQLGVC